MATAIVDAVNSSGCPEYSAALDSANNNAVNIVFPLGVCMCISDSISGISLPFSASCSFVLACNNNWIFSVTFLGACPMPPQTQCVTAGAFGANAVSIGFDNIAAGTILSNEFAGLAFDNAVVNTSPFAVSSPNVVAPNSSLTPIHVAFNPPVLRAGANIDGDGFTGERRPQLRAFGPAGRSAVCDYGQGPDFQAIELSNCQRIVAIELGGVDLATCNFVGTDTFDNFLFEPALCGDMDGDQTITLVDI